MPVVLNPLERFVLLTMNQAPGVFVDLFGVATFQSVLAALRLGIFESLSAGPLSAAEVAQRINASERGTTILLDALVPVRYLKCRDGRYSNTRITNKWLLKDTPNSLAAGLEFWGMLLFDFWSDLHMSIRAGKPQLDFYHEWLNQRPGGWEAFQQFMITGARAMGQEIVTRVKLPTSARRLLDVGGGHGLYSIAFCRQNPSLAATVFDLPGAVEVAQGYIQQERIGDRVTTRAADIWQAEWDSGYDVILLFNFVHTYLPEANRQLLQRVMRSLNPGGMVIILEQFAGSLPGAFAQTFAEMAKLNFFHMVGGQGYSAKEIEDWLRELHLTDIQTFDLRSLPGNGVVVGYKPA